MMYRVSDNDVIDLSKVEYITIDRRQITFGEVTWCIYNNDIEAQMVFNNILLELGYKDVRFEKDKRKQSQTTLEKKEKAFEIFWNLYDKRHDYNKTKITFMNFSIETMREIVKAVKPYVESTPDKTYRKTPRSWLLNNSWKNEIILDRKKTNRYIKPKYIKNER
tara:strand:+ start:3090 stop:3581 length:492 start_codon:yes stop_codon:yes gene_type:complete